MRLSWLAALPVTASALSALPAQAKDGADISLHIVTENTQAPVASAALLVEKPETKATIAVGVTDKNGLGVVRGVPEGAYRLTISAAGYAPLTRDVLVGEATTALDFGKIALTPAGQEIVVTGERAQNVALGAGANSFSIANNALAQSGSVLSAMKSLPGITVEREGHVLLRGSDKVAILIDGKPSALTGIGNQTGLDAIPAANIERIDIINNPSARYGAQGRQAARSTVDFSLSRTFLKDRFKASLSVTDIFNRFGTKTTVNGVGVNTVYENYYETQAAMFSLEWKI